MYQSIKNIQSRLLAFTWRDIPAGMDPIEQKKLKIVAQTTLSGCAVLWIYALANAVLGFWMLTAINAIIGGASLLTFYSIGLKQKIVSKLLLIFVLPGMILSFPIVAGAIAAEYYFFTILVISFYLFDNTLGLAVTTVYSIGLFVFAKYVQAYPMWDADYSVVELPYYYTNLFVSTFLTASATNLFRNETARYQQQTEQAIADITAQVQQQTFLSSDAQNLTAELQNRIRKNFRLIRNIFTMHIQSEQDAKVKTALRNARSKVHAIGILHELFENRSPANTGSLAGYIENICRELLCAFGKTDSHTVTFSISELHLSIPINKLTHIGLIVNELVTNAIKYGASANGKNSIGIATRVVDDFLEIAVSDSGPGFSKPVNQQERTSFGLDLVQTLASEYRGKLCIEYGADLPVRVLLSLTHLNEGGENG